MPLESPHGPPSVVGGRLERVSVPHLNGVHLVGSINLPDAETTFRTVSERLGAHAARLPDGEVGERFHWILFQGTKFEQTSGLHRVGAEPFLVAGFDLRPVDIDEGVDPDGIEFGPLGYADAALSSYAAFSALRERGEILPGTRFQVSLPTPLAPLTTFAVPSAQPALYPAYEAALAREIEQITAAIPADDLAIQFDLATEFAFIEQVSLGGGPLTPWFAEAGADADSIIAGCVVAASRVANLVPAGVQLGFHLCYGDVAEKHFVEPSDTANLVAVANGLTTGVTRRIDWVHLPVPIERDDSDYFVPLAALNLRAETGLFLGVVHHEDGVAGAHRRLEAAEPALTTAGIRQVGIATECGFGRGPQERTVPLLDLHAEILSTLGAKH